MAARQANDAVAFSAKITIIIYIRVFRAAVNTYVGAYIHVAAKTTDRLGNTHTHTHTHTRDNHSNDNN